MNAWKFHELHITKCVQLHRSLNFQAHYIIIPTHWVVRLLLLSPLRENPLPLLYSALYPFVSNMSSAIKWIVIWFSWKFKANVWGSIFTWLDRQKAYIFFYIECYKCQISSIGSILLKVSQYVFQMKQICTCDYPYTCINGFDSSFH